MDAFFDRINLLLWPRIKSVLSDQLASIGPAKDAALVQKGVMAHPVTRRSGELMASLYQLCTDVSGVDAGHMAGEGQMKVRGVEEGSAVTSGQAGR